MVSELGDRGARESNRAIVVVCGGVLEPPPPRFNARVRDLGSPGGDRIVTSSQSLNVSSPCVDHPPPTTAAARFYTSLPEMGAASFVVGSSLAEVLRGW